MRALRFLFMPVLMVLFAGMATATSTKIAYQGQLREMGVPVTANKDMVFRLFTSSTGGAAVWNSGTQTVSLISGLFRTLLEPTGVDWEQTIFIEIEVEGTPLSPREELTASPYAVDSLLLSGKAYTSAAAAPTSPSDGDLWFDTVGGMLNVWSGVAWDGLGSAAVVLSSGAISDVHISTGAAIKLSKLEKDPSQIGTLNVSTNPIDWSQLKNVPASFADGADNTGGGTPAVHEGGVVVDAAVLNFNFSGPNFDVTGAPAGQANISLDASSVTLQGNAFNAANKLLQLNSSGNVPSAIMVSSVASAAVLDASIVSVSGSKVTGALAVGVMVSSVATSAVLDPSIVSVSGSKVTGALSSALLDVSSVTKQGNTFNTANSLLLLNGSGLVANSLVDVSSITKQGNVFNGNNGLVQLTGTGLILNSLVDASSVTKQGNSFNAANTLLQLSGTGLVPNALLDTSSVTKAGNVFNTNGSVVRLGSVGQLAISTWSVIAGHVSVTKSVSFGVAADGACNTDTIGVAGAADGDTIALGIPASIASSAVPHIISAYVSSDGVVTVRRCNPQCDGGLTAVACTSLPALSGVIRVDVWKH